MKKTYLFAFIDDMSRLVPHGESTSTNRSTATSTPSQRPCQKGTPEEALCRQGPAFSTQVLRHAMASLGMALVHSRPYEPEGRGKVERFFRTVRGQFLSGIPDGLSLEELNTRLKGWIDEYHLREHGTTKEAPISRYAKHLHCVREAPKEPRVQKEGDPERWTRTGRSPSTDGFMKLRSR